MDLSTKRCWPNQSSGVEGGTRVVIALKSRSRKSIQVTRGSRVIDDISKLERIAAMARVMKSASLDSHGEDKEGEEGGIDIEPSLSDASRLEGLHSQLQKSVSSSLRSSTDRLQKRSYSVSGIRLSSSSGGAGGSFLSHSNTISNAVSNIHGIQTSNFTSYNSSRNGSPKESQNSSQFTTQNNTPNTKNNINGIVSYSKRSYSVSGGKFDHKTDKNGREKSDSLDRGPSNYLNSKSSSMSFRRNFTPTMSRDGSSDDSDVDEKEGKVGRKGKGGRDGRGGRDANKSDRERSAEEVESKRDAVNEGMMNPMVEVSGTCDNENEINFINIENTSSGNNEEADPVARISMKEADKALEVRFRTESDSNERVACEFVALQIVGTGADSALKRIIAVNMVGGIIIAGLKAGEDRPAVG